MFAFALSHGPATVQFAQAAAEPEEDYAEDSEDDSPGLFESGADGDEATESDDDEFTGDSEEEDDEGSGGGLFESSVESAAEESGDSGSNRSFDMGGHIRSIIYVGASPESTIGFTERPAADFKAVYAQFGFTVDAKAGKWGSAFAELRLRPGFEDGSWKLRFDPREAYVNLYLGPFDFRLGHQIIVWGRADGINPTNVLTPIDLRIRSPWEDDRRLANTGLRTFVNIKKVRLEGVWMPIYRANEVPTLPLDDYVYLTEQKLPLTDLSRSTLAGRAHLELPSFETSVSYVFGHAPMSGLALESYTLASEDSAIRVARVPYAQHLLGFDFSTTFGRAFGLRGEFAYRKPLYFDRVEVAQPDLQYVVGVDREFGPVSVIAQYYGRYVIGWYPLEELDNPFDVAQLGNIPDPVPDLVDQRVRDTINQRLLESNRMLQAQQFKVQHSASLRVELKTLHDNLSISAFALANFTSREWVIYPRATYAITDGLYVSGGAEMYFGPEGTLMGMVQRRLSGAYIDFTYRF